MKGFVIAGIGTGIGKTLVSSILVEALEADYWKPIQAGDLKNSDSLTVQNLISNSVSVLHPQRYCLTQPMSPHAAAKLDGVEIKLSDLSLPETNNNLIVELAGGIMVPLNANELNLDLLKQWKLPVVLVSQNYLGSINHSLLSLEILKNNKVTLAGIVFNGDRNKESENFILNYSKVKYLGHIPSLQQLNKQEIKKIANSLLKVILNL